MTDWAEEEPTPELVKATITTAEVAELYGFEISSSGKIPSLSNPDERTPSLHVYADDGGWYDFSAGKGGDVIDFVMAVEGCTFSQAMWRLWRKALKAGREPGDVDKQPARAIMDFTEQLNQYHVSSPAKHGWEDRLGLPLPHGCVAVPVAPEGYDLLTGDLLIPHRDAEGVYGVKVRSVDGSKSAWPGSIFTKRLYDPHGWDSLNGGYECVITEGESDCWALLTDWGHGVDVFALPAGAGTWKDHWLKDLECYERIWICMDNDRAGEAARQKITSKVGHLRAEQLRVPPLYNDAREAIAAGWRPSL